ncbi:MAG: GntR family transcriptional regulator [Dermatophilaceae bacterium]
MSSAIALDLTDPTPPYEQLRRQVASLIETGQLAMGERLPPVRQLARDLGIAPGTVARAYQELEQAGLVTTRRGGGTTVAPVSLSPSRLARTRLDAAAATFVAQVRTLGFAQDDAHEAVARAWR